MLLLLGASICHFSIVPAVLCCAGYIAAEFLPRTIVSLKD